MNLCSFVFKRQDDCPRFLMKIEKHNIVDDEHLPLIQIKKTVNIVGVRRD